MLCCPCQFYSLRSIYLHRTKPKAKSISAWLTPGTHLEEIECFSLTDTFMFLRTVEEPSAAFPWSTLRRYVWSGLRCLRPSASPPLLSHHFSLLQTEFCLLSLCYFSKIKKKYIKLFKGWKNFIFLFLEGEREMNNKSSMTRSLQETIRKKITSKLGGCRVTLKVSG